MGKMQEKTGEKGKISDKKILLDEWVGLGYNTRCQCDGLSPNGKATDSDSVIVKVRILLAQLKKLRRDISSELFAILNFLFQETRYTPNKQKVPGGRKNR